MGDHGRSTISGALQESSLAPMASFLRRFPEADVVLIVHDHSTDTGAVLYDEVVIENELVPFCAWISITVARYLGDFWEKVMVGYPNRNSRRILVNLSCGSSVTQETSRMDLERMVESLSRFRSLLPSWLLDVPSAALSTSSCPSRVAASSQCSSSHLSPSSSSLISSTSKTFAPLVSRE